MIREGELNDNDRGTFYLEAGLRRMAEGGLNGIVIVYILIYSDRNYYRPLMRNYLHLYFKLNRMEHEPSLLPTTPFPVQALSLQNINLILAFLDA